MRLTGAVWIAVWMAVRIVVVMALRAGHTGGEDTGGHLRGWPLHPTQEEQAMIRVAVLYARYALSALATVAFSLSAN